VDTAICAEPVARWMYGDCMDFVGSRNDIPGPDFGGAAPTLNNLRAATASDCGTGRASCCRQSRFDTHFREGWFISRRCNESS
jgi:hypothetical protein